MVFMQMYVVWSAFTVYSLHRMILTVLLVKSPFHSNRATYSITWQCSNIIDFIRSSEVIKVGQSATYLGYGKKKIEKKMQRNTRNTRTAPKPFVSGGVISNFTGDKPVENLPASTVSSREKSIFIYFNSAAIKPIEHGVHEKSAYLR